MTKSTKKGEVVYNFLDADRYNVELLILNQSLKNVIRFELSLFTDYVDITQETAKDLIKVLQEFVDTGELK